MLNRLRDPYGTAVEVEESESCVVTVTFYDTQDPAQVLDKDSLDTLVCTLVNSSDGAVINSRNAQSVLDANGGTVASDGTLTLKLQPADNPIVGTPATAQTEVHYLLLQWTWTDAQAVSMTGRAEWEVHVRQIVTPV